MSSHIFTIAPHAPFLPTLARRVLDGTLIGDWDITGPFGLSDITIILPTRRARLALAEAFVAELGGTALLPDIRTFGGTPEEEEPFLPPFEAPPLPKAMSAMERKLILASMVERWINARSAAAAADPAFAGFANPPSPAEILMLAESLGDVIDDCLVENIPAADLTKIDTGDQSGHWQTNLDFLQIALQAWPQVLAEQNQIDAADRRNQQLNRQADAAHLIFGDRPVIAAGSTGSIPATAHLLKSVAALPRGALVLPGLDVDMPTASRAKLSDAAKAPHGHAQYGLNTLLTRLEAKPEEVTELAPHPHPRTKILRNALALPDDIEHWAEMRATLMPQMAEALDSISIAVARTDEEQARAIALAAHDALGTGKTVGIISPDRNLARRITLELNRFDIQVDDSAGTPLFQSRAGRLARQILALARSNYAPVDMVALLRNRHTILGQSRAGISTITDNLELAILRGQRAGPGLDGLSALVATNLDGTMRHPALKLTQQQADQILALFTALEQALSPLCRLLSKPDFGVAEWGMALLMALNAITATAETDDKEPDAELLDLRDWLTKLQTYTTGPRLGAIGIEAAFDSLLAGSSVRPARPTRHDIAIWGALEARLQNPDLMILAGMSEGIWPEAADPGPWLSRAMRLAIGLEPPERRQGQAAHDFEMAMGNKEVLITRAERVGTSPANASRLVQRLEAFIGETSKALHAKGDIWVTRVRDLDFTGAAQPASRPAPSPPASLRPKQLSVTEIESLIRSPYNLYARHVLRLRLLAPLGEDPDLSERGTLVHAILGQFIEDGHQPDAPDALDLLMQQADTAFASLDALPERRILWTARFRPIAESFLAFECARQANIKIRHAELSGKHIFERPDGNFTLIGRADRIDETRDGTLEILDFKTGTIPDAKEMTAFTAPQLLLEAAMAREGGFDPVPPLSTSAITYIKLAFGPEPFEQKPFKPAKPLDIEGAVDEVIRRLSMQVDAYLFSDTVPMSAEIYPNPKQRYEGDYDHLARKGEWAGVDGDEEGGL